MKKLTTHILVLLCFCKISFLNAQDFEWIKQIGGSASTSSGNKMLRDRSGNLIIMGNFSGVIDFDPGPSSYTMSSYGSNPTVKIFLLKLDSLGNFLWVKKLSVGSDVALDRLGNIFITGTCSGTVDIDPGPETYTLTGVSDSPSAFVLKLGLTGDFIYAKSFNTQVGSCSGNLILLDSLLNIYTIGSLVVGPVDFDPGINTYTMGTSYVQYPSGSTYETNYYLSKLDSNGNFVYVRKIASDFGQGSLKASINKNGEIVIMEGHPAYSNSRPSGAYILKYNANGNMVWGKSIPYFSFRAMCMDPANNICIVGATTTSIDVMPGTGTFYVGAVSGYPASTFFLQLSKDGTFIWAKSIDNIENGPSISVFGNTTDESGTQYICGTYKGVIDFDAGDPVFTMSSVNGNGFILKLNAQGDFKGVVPIGKNGSSSANSIVCNNNGSLYTTGSFAGTVNFDPGTGIYDLAAFGTRNSFVHKINSQIITDIETQTLENGLRFFPNPVASMLYLQINDDFKNAVCRIIDINGKVVLEQYNINGPSFSIDATGQLKGLYILQISDAKINARIKFLKD